MGFQRANWPLKIAFESSKKLERWISPFWEQIYELEIFEIINQIKISILVALDYSNRSPRGTKREEEVMVKWFKKRAVTNN